MKLKFEEGLKPADWIEDATSLKKAQAKSAKLNDELQKQHKIVNRANDRHSTLVINAGRMDKNSADPKSITAAKKAVIEQARIVDEERDMLDAIRSALSTANYQVSQCGNNLDKAVKDQVSKVARKAQEAIAENLDAALEDYLACEFAINGTGVGGGQYLIEQKSYDNNLAKRACDRINVARQSLFDAVT